MVSGCWTSVPVPPPPNELCPKQIDEILDLNAHTAYVISILLPCNRIPNARLLIAVIAQ